MADQIKITRKVDLIKSLGSTSRTIELQSREIEIPYESYGEGEINLANGISDFALLGDHELVLLECDDPFEVKVGGIGNTAITTKLFTYQGAPASIHLGNPGAEAILVKYAVAIETP